MVTVVMMDRKMALVLAAADFSPMDRMENMAMLSLLEENHLLMV